MKFVAIITRRLRPGKNYEDYRRAWFHIIGFGVPTTMYTVIDVFDSRKIISIGVLDCEPDELKKVLEIDVEERGAHPLDDVVESTIVRTFGVVAAVDDFSSAGALNWTLPIVDGEITDYAVLEQSLARGRHLLEEAGAKRDAQKEKRGPFPR